MAEHDLPADSPQRVAFDEHNRQAQDAGGMSAELRPVFVLAAPRSGTSLLYKLLCLHPEAVWISNWLSRFPERPAVAALNRVAAAARHRRRRVWFGRDGANAYVYDSPRSLPARAFPMPVEGEPVFNRCGLAPGPGPHAADPARDRSLQRAFRDLGRFGGGKVVISKRIGHNQRLQALRSAFPQARFVAVVRDGRAVAYSLSRVDWWSDSLVWWYGDTPRAWEATGGDPWELCARHWVREVKAVEEGLAGADHVFRLRYEDLVLDPLGALSSVAAFAGLSSNGRWLNELAKLRYPDKNEAWRERLDRETVERVTALQMPELRRSGYLT